MPLDLRPASAFSLDDLAALFNAGYADYFVPFHVDAPALRAMNEAFDVDADASRVALRDGEPVGLANLALRGTEAWIGGVGVVPQARRSGVGEALMLTLHDEARARGVETVWLEVIEQNEAAFRLYEKLGYEVTREVEVWRLDGDETGRAASELPVAEAHERIRRLRTVREPWQRADGTLAHYDDLEAVATGRGAAIFRAGPVVQLFQIAGADLEELFRTMRGRGAVSAVNIATDDPAAAALRALNGIVVVRQHEMALRL